MDLEQALMEVGSARYVGALDVSYPQTFKHG